MHRLAVLAALGAAQNLRTHAAASRSADSMLALLLPSAAPFQAAPVRGAVRPQPRTAALRPRAMRGPTRVPAVVARDDGPSEEEAKAERAETIEYLKTLGGFTAAATGGFFALEACGLDDIAAGNAVLLALCAYGAGLLFFDGGVTQAALESQAIRQLAFEEGEILEQAPRAEIAELRPGDAASAVAALDKDGAVRIDEVLSPESSQALLAHVNACLEEKRKALQAQDLRAESSFGDVLMRENRYDLYLDLDPPVKDALQEALAAMAPTLAGALGPDAELFELAALVADPKAPRQPVHPDTPYREGEGAAILTTFVALQDVEPDMGPTDIVPRTHTAEAHVRFNAQDDGGREKVQLLREYGNHKGVLRTGDANVIDSRLIHAGGGNDSRKRRVLFYFSFRRKGKITPSGSLAYELRREGYTLDQLQAA